MNHGPFGQIRILLPAGLVLLPITAVAHALSPTHFPLGPLPLLLGKDWWPFLFLIPLAVTAQALVLRAWMPRLAWPACFRRSGVLYFTARAMETALIYGLQSVPLVRRTGWTSSMAENLGPLVAFLVAGLLAAAPVGWLLCRRSGSPPGLVLKAVVTGGIAAYLAALGGGLGLMLIRGY